MKKYIFSLIFLGIQLCINCQVQFQIGSVSGDSNDIVTVPVSVVSGFNKLGGMLYSFNYDSNVLAIVDIGLIKDPADTTRLLYDVLMATHVGSANIKNGQLVFNWFEAGFSGKTISNGTVLFNLRFRLIGNKCDSSIIRLSNMPRASDVFDSDLNNLTFNVTSGKAKINGAGCVSGPPPPDTSGLLIIASNETSPQGVVKCIKITANNLEKLQSGQFTMHWDPLVAKFESIVSGAWTLLFGQNYAALSDSSGVRIIWDSGIDSLTVADGTTLFEVCLTPVGQPGTMTSITFNGVPTPIEFYDVNGNIPVKFTSGKLTITNAPAQTIHLYVRDTIVDQGTTFCIPIRVDNFKCVESFQFSISYDTNKLKFLNLIYILPTLGPNNFFIVKDSIRVQWDATTGPKDLPNGGALFSICFESKVGVPCPFDTKLLFTNLHSSPIEFIDCNSNEFAITKGEPDFTIRCFTPPTMVTINEGTSTSVKCFGDCNGRITGTTIIGGRGPFQYEWKLQPFNIVVSDVLEPIDMCAGLYILCVTDLGNANAVKSSDTIRIKTPDGPLACTASITHVQIVNDGKIDLTVTGGTPPYTFMYFRLPSRPTPPRTEEDPMNLPAACYELKITDANGCTKIDTFCVNPRPLYIADTIQVNNKCFDECLGSICVTPAAGKPQYAYKWSKPGETGPCIDSLCVGTYTVTITDNTPSTITKTFIITQPDKIEITIDSVKKSTPSGSDGAIFITVKGGKAPFTFQWRNSLQVVLSTEEDPKNLAPDTYIVCVTDTNKCVQCDTVVVAPTTTTPPVISINLSIDPYLGNNAVSCRGKCDGKIVATVTSNQQNLPYTYKWSHDPNLPTNTSIVTNLCPGQSITVTVTDASRNSKVSSTLVVQDAPLITLSARKIDCASAVGTTDGSYEAITNNAVAPISYRWCNGSINKTANDLPSGPCSIQITDANGCSHSEDFTVCVGPNDIECYKGRLAISPNGDGYNEVLEIACVTVLENVLNIYDRWGNTVFSAVNYTNEWNGVNKSGEDLTEGTYMWILKVKESGREDAYYKGTVTIVR